MVEEQGGCAGFLSQKLTAVMRGTGLWGWLLVLPLRILPPLFDPLFRALGWPDFSVTVVAYKPRFAGAVSAGAASVGVGGRA